MDKNLLETLKKRAEQREENRISVKEFEVAGVPMKFVQLNQSEKLSYYSRFAAAVASREDEEFAEGLEEFIKTGAELIYDTCPSLQDPELHAELGITDPFDTVWKLMGINEINELAEELKSWLEITPEDTKN